MGAQHPREGQRQRDAMAEGEAGHHEGEVPQAARDQHHAHQERLVVDPGEDMHDAHAHVGQEPRILQTFAVLPGDGNIGVLRRHDPFDEVALGRLNLRQVYMGWHQVEECGRMQHDLLGRGAPVQELEPAVATGGRDGMGLRGQGAGLPARCDADVPGQIA